MKSSSKEHTLAGGIEGAHVEDVNALHLSDEFQTLETSGLVKIAGNGTGLTTRGDKVILSLDLCILTKRISQYGILRVIVWR
jgi:hypothetical protein